MSEKIIFFQKKLILKKGSGKGITSGKSGFAVNRGAVNRGFTVYITANH